MTKPAEPVGEDVIEAEGVACKGTRGCSTAARHRCPHCRRALCPRHARRDARGERICHKCRHRFVKSPKSPAAAIDGLAIDLETAEEERDVVDAPAQPTGTIVFVLHREPARSARCSDRGRALLARTWLRSSARAGERISVIGANAPLTVNGPLTLRRRTKPSRSARATRATQATPQIPLFV